MESVLERLPTGARIAVIRLRSLGDCVLTTPALQLLHDHRPDLRIGIVVEDRFRAVFERNPAIQDLLPPAAGALARWKPELALNLHGGTSSLVLTVSSRARLRAGFTHYRAQRVYNVRIPRAQAILGVERKVHTAEHIASAMFYLGVPTQDIPRGVIFAKPSPRRKPYAVLHPAASHIEKTWPAEHFGSVARHLESAGIEPVVLCGPGEANRIPAIEAVSGGLADAISLIAGACLFIGNDSGPAHVAAACGTPLVVLFGASDPVIWAPWKAQAVQIVRHPITAIQLHEVVAAAESLRVPA